MKFLYLSQLWPKNAFSAAHQRTFGILDRLLLNRCHISYVTPQDVKKAEEIKEMMGVTSQQADPSNTHRVNFVFSKVDNPQATFFDTYVSESLYSHYVHTLFPNSVKILDLQDLHSLRIQRAELLDDSLQQRSILQHRPEPTELLDKELSSIIRSDLIFTCSDYEYLLLKTMNVNHKDIRLLTFFYPTTRDKDQEDLVRDIMQRQFDRRKNFVFLGNMAHAPNLDSVKYLISKIWPQIHKALPYSQLHIYGSNFPSEVRSDLPNGIVCKGLMKDLVVLGKYRAMLAPIRFGAGIKGKITDAWSELLPVITTPIGAEGLFLESTQSVMYSCMNELKSSYYSDLQPNNLDQDSRTKSQEQQKLMEEYYNYAYPSLGDKLTFGGSFNNWTDEEFVHNSIQIYTQEDLWKKAINNGERILSFRMDGLVNEKILMKAISESHESIHRSRKNDVMQRLAWSETMRSNYHFAKYLNEKRVNKELMARFKQ